MELNPYLTFNGNCAEAFDFYADALDGEIIVMQRFNEMPGSDKMSPEMRNKVMHAQLKLGNRILMASDHGSAEPYHPPRGFQIQTGWRDQEKAKQVFAKLSAGGVVQMPFAETFWSPGFGTCIDKFAMPWMVNIYGPEYMSD
ncbi:MAG: VOC family protein [Marinosulfonomonas sp.]|nr:VOC family protein [Marinosulfonomonas sp.]